MGRSEKKAKSDRINILRKQYDAFLEDDKKRRERNEYILGKLDRMRTSTAVVLRHRTPKAFMDHQLAFCEGSNYAKENLLSRYDDINMRGVQAVVALSPSPTNIIDENVILKEISKKYIIIPKISSAVSQIPSEYVQVSDSLATKDEDWKNKYDILTQLEKNKKEDKEEIISKSNHAETVIIHNTTTNDIPERDIDKHQTDRDWEKRKDDAKVLEHKASKYNILGAQDNLNATPLNSLAYKTKQFNSDIDYHPSVEIGYASNAYQQNPDAIQEINQKIEAIYTDDNILPIEGNNTNSNPTKLLSHNQKETLKSTDDFPFKTGDSQLQDTLLDTEKVYAGNQVIQNASDSSTDQFQLKEDVVDYQNLQGNNETDKLELNQLPKLNNEDNNHQEINNVESKHENYMSSEQQQNSGDYAHLVSETGHSAADFKNVTLPVLNDTIQNNIVSDEIPSTDELPKQGTNEHEEIYPEQLNDLAQPNDIKLVENANLGPDEFVSVEDAYAREKQFQYDTQEPAAIEHLNVNPEDAEGIEAFDEENKNMFYSEEANVDYSEYNQEVYNAEQTYDPNATQAYYEGQEQSYPVEYAEDNATMQQYDQNYEQQYANTEYDQQGQTYQYDQQPYDQNPVADQNPQAFEQTYGQNPVADHIPQSYEQPVYDHNPVADQIPQAYEQQYEQHSIPVEQVQQDIDQEQGYMEQKVESNEPEIKVPVAAQESSQ